MVSDDKEKGILGKSDRESILFPYDTIRDIQNKMISLVENALGSRGNVVVHAPTGLGKTIATLGPALAYSLKKKTTVFFLTSRHTQHKIAIETLKDIRNKFDMDFSVADLIGKKWMCLQPGITLLNSHEFTDYCRHLREEDECEFFTNTKKGNKATVEAKTLLSEMRSLGPLHTDRMIDMCHDKKLCPFELTSILASGAQVIIADYYYMFHPRIRDSFLKRIGKSLNKSILIVDEGHNLPQRVRNLMSEKISNFSIRRAIQEAKKLKFFETIDILTDIQNVLNDVSGDLDLNNKEKLVDKALFMEKMQEKRDYDGVIDDLASVAETARETQKSSSIGAVSAFLEAWKGPDDGFVRILSYRETRNEPFITLSYRCLDPSLLTKDVIDCAHSTILMSGTLNPVDMYADVLGFPDNTAIVSFKSPFPKKNKLTLIINDTTTKFSRRGNDEFNKIGKISADIINIVPGNIIFYFPSYYLRDKIYQFMDKHIRKTVFLERPNMIKQDKFDMLERFKGYKDSGTVLLAVSGGNFYEGIDLPGDFLKAVVVVGLPLQQPNLEVKSLIEYYEGRFGKGWDYGYISPAFSKCLQAAGRCIRSETDRGLIVFLDERFAWNNYYKHFPADSRIQITKNFKAPIIEFFKKNKK